MNKIKVASPRSANVVNANFETLASEDGQRRVTFRNAKKLLGDGRFDIVRVAYCKQRISGKWVIVHSGVSEEYGTAFLAKARGTAEG